MSMKFFLRQKQQLRIYCGFKFKNNKGQKGDGKRSSWGRSEDMIWKEREDRAAMQEWKKEMETEEEEWGRRRIEDSWTATRGESVPPSFVCRPKMRLYILSVTPLKTAARILYKACK